MTDLKILYQEMADLTLPECKSICRAPLSCCSPEYCDATIEYAKEQWDVELQPTGHKTLPLMGETGCVAEPHLRPMCTLHTCDINGIGYKRGDNEWTKKYFSLRDRIERLEYERINDSK